MDPKTLELYVLDNPAGHRYVVRASGAAAARASAAEWTGDGDAADPAGGWTCHYLTADGEPGMILAGEWIGEDRA